LGSLAGHAEHVLGVLTNNLMVGAFIMTEAAGEPTTATASLKTIATPVVLAAGDSQILILICSPCILLGEGGGVDNGLIIGLDIGPRLSKASSHEVLNEAGLLIGRVAGIPLNLDDFFAQVFFIHSLLLFVHYGTQCYGIYRNVGIGKERFGKKD